MIDSKATTSVAVLNAYPAPDPTLTEADVLRSAEELVPLLRERAAATDTSRVIEEDVYRKLCEAGFMHMLRPAKWGGLEFDDHANAMAILNLARGCASTAWVVTVLSAGSLLVCGYPEEVHEEVWGPDTYASLAGNVNLNPNAKAERVEGGYRLSGQWGFCSGSDFSTWLIFNAPAGDNGAPHLFLVDQRDALEIDDWYPTGLRGTNSRTMVVDNVFVPDRRVLSMPAFLENFQERRAQFPTFDNLWNPFPSTGRFPFSSVAIGAALGASEYFAETLGSATRVATGMGGINKLADQEYILAEFAEASGELKIAKGFIEHRSREASARAAEHRLPTPAEVAEGSRDNALVARMAMRNVNRIFSLIGSKAGNPANPVSLAKRDIEMASSHVGVNWRNAAIGYMNTVLQG